MLIGNRAGQSLLSHTRLWYLINAKDQINGRLAAYIAQILQGKTKPIYHPSQDVGDFVVVVNTKDWLSRRFERDFCKLFTQKRPNTSAVAFRERYAAEEQF